MTSAAGLPATGPTANLLPASAGAGEGRGTLFEWDPALRRARIQSPQNPVASAGPFHPSTSGISGGPSPGTSKVWRSP